jgi:hypothetical protein
MKQGICHLCEENKELAESHIIPKFVFRWMKNTGGKYFRAPLSPNQRMQDGFKQYLLCFDCEQKFSKYEKWFADNIFFPYLNNRTKFLEYDENLSNFIISILWRRLLLNKIEGKEYFEDVFNDWKSYLNEIKPPRFDKIHLLFLGDIWSENVQPNKFVHRYFDRTADTNIAEIEGDIIVFAKFSRFLVFAELNGEGNNFRGTNVLFKKGRFPFVQFIDNGKISLFFLSRAEKIYHLVLKNISEKEREKIIEEINKKPQEFWDSDLWKSVSSDIDSKITPFVIDTQMNYVCDCCLSPMTEPEGYLLRTYEVIQSPLYWEFTFKNNGFGIDQVGLEKRIDYFKQIASYQIPWVICDECITMFDINIRKSKTYMDTWVSSKGNFRPPKCDDFRSYIDIEGMNNISRIIVTVNNI